MRNLYLVIILLACVASDIAAQKLQSPKEFLGYELGDRFTRHHRVMEYFKYVADAVPNVELIASANFPEGLPPSAERSSQKKLWFQ